ncbi:MAG: hypothetical protein K2J67_05365 [Lachnospiraceae bacterium]|nr:hypothetical protein [Lachnospiraceae bacterium]
MSTTMGNIFYNEVHNNTFHDSSVAVQVISQEKSMDEWKEIQDELNEIKENLNQESNLYHAIEDLQYSIERQNHSGIKKTIRDHVKEFSLPFFVKVASKTLMEWIQSAL